MTYFKGLSFFYRYLGAKILLALFLSFLVGILDGLGLTMFLPLLQLVGGDKNVAPSELGKLQFILDSMQSSGISLTVGRVLVFMVVFFVLKSIVSFIQYYYRVYLQEFFIRRIRISSLDGLNNLSYKAFLDTEPGTIQNVLTGEVERVSKAYQSYFLGVQSAMMVLVYITFAFLVDVQFAFLVTIGGLVSNLLYKQIYERTKGASRKLSDQTNDFQGLVMQHVGNYKYLKSTASLKLFSSKMVRLIDRIRDTNKHIGYLMSILNSAREPLVVAVIALIIYIQLSYVGSAMGPILVSLLFFYRALSFLMQMQTHINHYLSVSGSMGNVQEFLNELAAKKERSGAHAFTRFENKLVLENAGVTYRNRQALRDISLTIFKNQTIALVGESGSGKTTLINVICGLLPLEKGSYEIDGMNSAGLSIESFQRRIGYITQDPVIFNDSVFNNVTFWSEKTDVNVKRFWEALKKAAAYDFVTLLEGKEEFILSSNGTNLSGGQKQRISIARELYKDVDILILDEATSSLDSETERTIQENIDLLHGKYTMIIVAHRLSTIRHADRLCLLARGRIESVGTFNELLALSPDFNRIVQLQELSNPRSS
jgi:ABC-type multidrug transport system fused ATPase/permease subunit